MSKALAFLSGNSSSRSKNHTSLNNVEGEESHFTSDRNTESLLILERILERSGTQWVENLNTIEQFLVEIVEIIGQRQPFLRANFILRRLPMYTTASTNRNEYAIVLNNIDFSLQSNRRYSTVEKRISPNFGQLEIFKTARSIKSVVNANTAEASGETKAEKSFYEDVTNETNAFLSHEIFKKFATAFIRAGSPEPEDSEDVGEESEEVPKRTSEKVQLISPHLLFELETNTDVKKIFTIIPTTKSCEEAKRFNKGKTSRCRISVNYLKSLLTISLEDTEVIVRPCLFLEKGYAKVSSNILDRIPLFHSSISNICEALGKGCLLFPTSYDALWNLHFWPSESHLLCVYHPGSLISRVFKLFSAFCLNPLHFWETLNNCFLIGSDDTELMAERGLQHLSMEFLMSTFLYEMERFSTVQDWAPSNFYTRFMHLLSTSIDSYEKGFHSHYFTKANVLKGVWRDNFEREESTILKELDDIEEFPEETSTTVDTVERSRDYLDRDEDDDEDYCDLHFERLETTEDGDAVAHYTPPPLTSDMVYKSVNPFQSVEDLPTTTNPSHDLLHPGSSGNNKQGQQQFPKKPKSLSKMFGSNLLHRFASSLGRSSSDAAGKTNRSNSMADITSGFAEHIAQNRREQTFGMRGSSPACSTDAETSFSSNYYENKTLTLKSSKKARARSHSVPSASMGESMLRGHHHHHRDTKESRDGVEMSTVNTPTFQTETIYSNIFQILKEIPPSDHFSDSEVIQDLDRLRKILESQEELIVEWCHIMTEIPTPKTVCPHTFSARQVQYISQIIQKISQCSSGALKASQVADAVGQPNLVTKIPAWEISGDLLRTVLHQMRSEPALHDSFKEKVQKKPVKRLSLKVLRNFSLSTSAVSEGGGSGSTSSPGSTLKKLSFKRRHSDICTGHLNNNDVEGENGEAGDLNGETQFALEEPEIAATNRLLQWLWQLKTSNIGRLSFKAKRYLEFLHRTSFDNSHFTDQFSEEKIFQTMAIRSAVAVSRIMRDEKFPAYVPLLAATKKGWQWAEMVLSLASWNNEKGFPIEADIPTFDGQSGVLLRDVSMPSASISNTLKSIKSSDPDADAVTLAFHSELATPLGWNDFEDPRRPGPFTVPILIFSSLGYFKQWEMIPGNIVQVMVRLQKFNNLQHVGALLFPPHRKTALNEVRKLNKSLSFRNYQFDNNVMSKTFRRLASLSSSRIKQVRAKGGVGGTSQAGSQHVHNCINCQNLEGTLANSEDDSESSQQESEIECTRL